MNLNKNNSTNVKSEALTGLVLAGGKSMRMGRDKATIAWHGKEQQYYIADLLEEFCEEVFISYRELNTSGTETVYQSLIDTRPGLGPYGALLTAFEKKPACAWLVVACDLPLVNKPILEFLVKHRNLSSIATTFQSPFDKLPEPLITIWEPRSYPVLLSFSSQGITCPRKALINSDATILQAPDPQALMNVNTKEEALEAEKIIGKQKLFYAG